MCTDGESLRLRDVGQEEGSVTYLQRRIDWLESILRSRCPDVNLTQGPGPEPTGDSEEFSDRTVSVPAQNDSQPDEYMPNISPQTNQHAPQPIVASPHEGSTVGNSSLLHEIGMVSVGTSMDQRYVGPSSGFFLARILLNSFPKAKRYASATKQRRLGCKHQLLDIRACERCSRFTPVAK